MNKEKVIVYDFTKVMIEEKFGEFKEVNVSQTLGNVIHQNTGDIGLDEIARTIYREGKAAIPEMYIPVIVAILKNPDTNMVVSAKRAVIEILTPKEKRYEKGK